jgi:hypothetical protein
MSNSDGPQGRNNQPHPENDADNVADALIGRRKLFRNAAMLAGIGVIAGTGAMGASVRPMDYCTGGSFVCNGSQGYQCNSPFSCESYFGCINGYKTQG